MKYSNLIICGVPKTFDIWDSPDYLQPISEDMKPDDILYDMYPAGFDDDKEERAAFLFKYKESATGAYLVHSRRSQTLTLSLSPWAVEADVYLYAAYINSILAKHKRAKLYDKYAPLRSLSDEMVSQMIKERKNYLRRLFTTKEGFTMEGLNTDYTLQVAHLRPAPSLDMQILELQQVFVEMQWTFPEDGE